MIFESKKEIQDQLCLSGGMWLAPGESDDEQAS